MSNTERLRKTIMRKKSFAKVIQFLGIIFLIVFGLSNIAIDIIRSYRNFNRTANQMRTDYTVQQKDRIKQEVIAVVDLIHQKKALSETQLKLKIKNRVYEACTIAQQIYQNNKGTKSDLEIQQMIIAALSHVRFQQGSGYYFISRLDGVAILFPSKPELEGLNLQDTQDTQGNYLTKDMIRIIQQSEEGFYQYHWTKPNNSGDGFNKIAFVKDLQLYDWFIGTGLYVDDFEAETTKDLLQTISKIRYEKEGYIFVNRLNGDALISNGRVFSGTKKLWEEFDKKAEKTKAVFDKEYKAALIPGGDYIYYTWVKLTDSQIESPKVSFIYGLPDLHWLVGAGVYLDDVETEIEQMQIALIEQVKIRGLYSLLVTVSIIAFFLLLFNGLSRKLKKDFDLFILFFKRAVISDELINQSLLQFEELDQIAETANKILVDRRQSEKALEVSEKKFRRISENTPAVVGQFKMTKDGTFSIPYVNDATASILGVKAENATSWDASDLLSKIHPEDQEMFIKGVMKSAQTLKTYHEIFRFLKNEEIIWLECRTTPKIMPDESILWDGFLVDVSKRKQIEGALLESEERYRNIFRGNHLPMLLIDSESGNIIDANPSAFIYYGWNFEELIGKNISEINTLSKEEVRKEIDNAKAKQQNHFHFQHRTANGTIRDVEVNSNPITVSGKTLLYSTIHDITDRKRAKAKRKSLEIQLRQSQKLEAIGTMVGGISHELNNVLQSIFLHGGLIQDALPDDKELQENLQHLLNDGKRARDIVKQILTFSRKTKVEMKPQALHNLILESLSLERASFPPNIDIKQDIDLHCGLVLCDKTQIHQIIINLGNNAEQAMGNTGGTLTVRLQQIWATMVVDKPKIEVLELTVTDTGHGMDTETLGQVFNPFLVSQ